MKLQQKQDKRALAFPQRQAIRPEALLPVRHFKGIEPFFSVGFQKGFDFISRQMMPMSCKQVIHVSVSNQATGRFHTNYRLRRQANIRATCL